MKFTDGMEFDTTGPYRVEQRSDGYYVVGEGFLCPVEDRVEGMTVVYEMNRIKGKAAQQPDAPTN